MLIYHKAIIGYHYAVALCECDNRHPRYEVRVYYRGYPFDYSLALATNDPTAAERAFDARVEAII